MLDHPLLLLYVLAGVGLLSIVRDTIQVLISLLELWRLRG